MDWKQIDTGGEEGTYNVVSHISRKAENQLSSKNVDLNPPWGDETIVLGCSPADSSFGCT